MASKKERLFRALARSGLDVSYEDGVYTVRLYSEPSAPPAEVLLPETLPLEEKALRQIAALAAVRHHDGGRVLRAIATPDFHPGDGGIAIGSVIAARDIIIPAAVGSDINCGMRLHVTDLTLEEFLGKKISFIEAMKGDYFCGTRDLPMTKAVFCALFREGLIGWISAAPTQPLGRLAYADFAQLTRELNLVAYGGSFDGEAQYADERYASTSDIVRDAAIGTIGGGNHFVEVQIVEEIADRKTAWSWGVRQNQIVFMIHSGSRDVGLNIASRWRDKARASWPSKLKHPNAGIFPISLKETPKLAAQYLAAEATAANYGFLNRLLLAELLRLRLREVYGRNIEAPLVYDVPHNFTIREGDWFVTRKGACPAPEGQPVITPGSMGTPSYLLVGRGNERFLGSASHGAGRSERRFSLARGGNRRTEAELGLTGVECVTPRPERRIEEAPAAYKPITPVIESQVAAGIVTVVAKMRPILTFKA